MNHSAQRQRVFSKTQIFFICFGVLSHLSLLYTVLNFFQTGNWGYPRVGWINPNRTVSIAGGHYSSNGLITYHVLSSYCLYFGLLVQLGLMVFLKRSAATIRVHRAIGITILCVLGPAFVFLALVLNFFLIESSVNKILFGIIPVMICYGMLTSVVAIRSGDKVGHIDGMYIALIMLNAAPTMRIVTGILYLSGVPVTWLMTTNESNPTIAIIRTFIVIVILTVSFLTAGRLKQNRYPLLLLSAAFVYTISLYE